MFAGYSEGSTLTSPHLTCPPWFLTSPNTPVSDDRRTNAQSSTTISHLLTPAFHPVLTLYFLLRLLH